MCFGYSIVDTQMLTIEPDSKSWLSFFIYGRNQNIKENQRSAAFELNNVVYTCTPRMGWDSRSHICDNIRHRLKKPRIIIIDIDLVKAPIVAAEKPGNIVPLRFRIISCLEKRK